MLAARTRSGSRGSGRWVALAACLLVLSCSGISEPGAPDPSPEGKADDLDLRALLLLLEDRRVYDDFTVGRALAGDPRLRRRLAHTLGRLDDPRGGVVLEELLLDAEVEVRRAAAFALGRRGRPGAIPALLAACRSPDAETGRLAVEALAVLGADLDEVLRTLDELPAEEVWPRLLPSLFRFPGRRTLALAAHGLELEDRRLAAWAAYSLGRNPVPQAAGALRGLLADPDPWIRSWAARGLGQVGDASDPERLLTLSDDPAFGPRIQALRAAGTLVASGRAAPDPAWREAILDLMEDRRPGVALSAIEAAAYWLLDDELGRALLERFESGDERARELALLALARGGHPRARELAGQEAASADAARRASAATASAALGDRDLLSRLIADPAPAVRLAALAGVLSAEPSAGAASTGDRRAVSASALADPDPAVRAAALDWLVANPELPVEALEGALAPVDPTRLVELPVNAVRALAARAVRQPLERDRILERLGEIAIRGDYPVRRLAAARIEELGEPRPAAGPAVGDKGLRTYRGIVRRTAAPRFAELVTAQGVVRLRLACPEAPLTCLSFLQLAEQGFYDGLAFHRLVPDFVVQGGDPRGDGWGGPGYTIRDEAGPLRFGDGVLGMALSGPDTAGSQFFITLSPQPHLDGVFTAFGEVVEGREALDRLRQGDSILRIRESR